MNKKNNKLLIDGSIEQEIRIALIGSENKLLEYNVCKKEDHVLGNIYVAKIVEIKVSIEAVFVDFGNGNTGFLSFDNIHPNSFIHIKKDKNFNKLNVEDVLQKGQLLIVQVSKTGLNNKCPVVTTYINLAGKNSIFLPNDKGNSGISRKISGEARSLFKEFISQLNEKGVSLIIRTASFSSNLQEIKQDYQRLDQLWKNIKKNASRKKKPGLIYQDDVLLKYLRGYSNYSVSSVHISNRVIFKQIQEYVQKELVAFPDNLHFSSKNIFEKIESQIDKLYNFELELKSGGFISIHKTEALCSIDVNSRAALKNCNLEETAFNTNKEAIELIAQQVILRDISGIIVIDCIDMSDSENINVINKLVKECFKNDKAEINILPLSEIGLIQISRSRQNLSILARDFEVCNMCSGFGYYVKEDTLTIQLLRKIINLEKKDQKIKIYTSIYILKKLLNDFFEHINQHKIQWETVDLDDVRLNLIDSIEE